jgi:L-aminopeptidase/D-esterase-like protein
LSDGVFHATTLAVIATNVTLTKTHLTKLAMMANTGCARAINPYHTQGDGDQVLAISTGLVGRDVSLTALGAVASELVADSIGRAVRAATGIPDGRRSETCDVQSLKCQVLSGVKSVEW